MINRAWPRRARVFLRDDLRCSVSTPRTRSFNSDRRKESRSLEVHLSQNTKTMHLFNQTRDCCPLIKCCINIAQTPKCKPIGQTCMRFPKSSGKVRATYLFGIRPLFARPCLSRRAAFFLLFCFLLFLPMPARKGDTRRQMVEMCRPRT